MNLEQRTAWLFPQMRLQSMRCFFNPPQAQQNYSPSKGMDSRRSLFRGNGLRPGPSHLAVIGLFYRLRVVKERYCLSCCSLFAVALGLRAFRAALSRIIAYVLVHVKYKCTYKVEKYLSGTRWSGLTEGERAGL